MPLPIYDLIGNGLSRALALDADEPSVLRLTAAQFFRRVQLKIAIAKANGNLEIRYGNKTWFK